MREHQVRPAPKKPKGRPLRKAELARLLDGGADRLQQLDLLGTGEAAQVLGVERARIGRWRERGILFGDGTRAEFPSPIYFGLTVAKIKECKRCGHTFQTKDRACGACGSKQYEEITDHLRLGATPLWWGDDIRALAAKMEKLKVHE